MSVVIARAPGQSDHGLHSAAMSAHLADMPQGWTIKKVESNSLDAAPGPSGVAHRIALWLDEWSMRSYSHDTHHWATKSEVLRGLKNIGRQVGR